MRDFPLLFKKKVLLYLVQCTSPFLKVKDLIKSYELIKNNSYEKNCLISGYFLNRFIWKSESNIENWIPINYEPKDRPRTQDNSPLFAENGAFYAFGSSNYELTKCRIHGDVGIFEMDEIRSIDIDEKKDLDYAIFLENYLQP